MPTEMGIWRIDGGAPRRLGASQLPTETMLEEFLEQDPSLLGERLLVVGRQVRTPYGKYIDLLAMDGEGNLHVLELKRDKTPREVVAQVLDYGSWVSTLDRETVIDLANEHLDEPFETAFEEVFVTSAPDEINASLNLVVVATDLDSSSERIVTYLREFGVPVNVVFFTHLEDDGRRYLAPLVARRRRRHGRTIGNRWPRRERKARRVERHRLVRLLRRRILPLLGRRTPLRLCLRRQRQLALGLTAQPARRRTRQRPHPQARVRRCGDRARPRHAHRRRYGEGRRRMGAPTGPGSSRAVPARPRGRDRKR